MPNVRQRRQARVRKRLKTELAGQFKRQQGRIERSISDRALMLSRSKESVAAMLPRTIGWWNGIAEHTEAEFGEGWFPVRLARRNAFSFGLISTDGTPIDYGPLANKLLYLSATKDDPFPYQWMADLLFMTTFPEFNIHREAHGRDGLWHRRLRKTKENIALARHRALQ